MFVGIVVIVILLLAYVFVRKPKPNTNVRPDKSDQASTTSDSAFHAVSLRFPPSACDAAKAMEGRRFLSTAAPRIPLPDCDVLECKCRFVHHQDRRKGDDRRNPYTQGFGTANTGKFRQEQRKRGERREEPPDDAL